MRGLVLHSPPHVSTLYPTLTAVHCYLFVVTMQNCKGQSKNDLAITVLL